MLGSLCEDSNNIWMGFMGCRWVSFINQSSQIKTRLQIAVFTDKDTFINRTSQIKTRILHLKVSHDKRRHDQNNWNCKIHDESIMFHD